MSDEPNKSTFPQYGGVIRKPTAGIEMDSEFVIDCHRGWLDDYHIA